MQTDYKITYNTTVNAPIEKVWDALINPEIVKLYFFGTELIADWAVGNDIIFKGEWEGEQYQDKGKILTFLPNKELSYSYFSNFGGMEDKPENYLWVCYQVIAEGNQTGLTIQQSNYNQEKADNSAAGWAAIIDGLKKIVE